MKRLVAFVLATSLAGLPAVAAARADAATGCVTRAEFGAIKVGWTKARVHRTFGTTGVRAERMDHGGHVMEDRVYDVCRAPRSEVIVSYETAHGEVTLRVTAKQWVG